MKVYRYSKSKICDYCKTVYFPRKTIAFEDARFCSRTCACRHISKRTHPISKICRHCKKAYFPPINKPFEASICCSKACLKKCLSDTPVKCKGCKKPFFPKLHEHKRDWCSRSCCSKHTMSPLFKPLKTHTPEMRLRRLRA